MIGFIILAITSLTYCQNETEGSGMGPTKLPPELLYCNGNVSTSPYVCSGHGLCMRTDLCLCDENYQPTQYGSDCVPKTTPKMYELALYFTLNGIFPHAPFNCQDHICMISYLLMDTALQMGVYGQNSPPEYQRYLIYSVVRNGELMACFICSDKTIRDESCIYYFAFRINVGGVTKMRFLNGKNNVAAYVSPVSNGFPDRRDIDANDFFAPRKGALIGISYSKNTSSSIEMMVVISDDIFPSGPGRTLICLNETHFKVAIFQNMDEFGTSLFSRVNVLPNLEFTHPTGVHRNTDLFPYNNTVEVICTGDNYECSGVKFSEFGACSNNGECMSQDVCQCHDGFSGTNCEFLYCFGSRNDEIFCSGRCSCVKPNGIVCEKGWEMLENGTCVTQLSPATNQGVFLKNYDDINCDVFSGFIWYALNYCHEDRIIYFRGGVNNESTYIAYFSDPDCMNFTYSIIINTGQCASSEFEEHSVFEVGNVDRTAIEIGGFVSFEKYSSAVGCSDGLAPVVVGVSKIPCRQGIVHECFDNGTIVEFDYFYLAKDVHCERYSFDIDADSVSVYEDGICVSKNSLFVVYGCSKNLSFCDGVSSYSTPNVCNGKGICRANGTCKCDDGWEGPLCSEFCGFPDYDDCVFINFDINDQIFESCQEILISVVFVDSSLYSDFKSSFVYSWVLDGEDIANNNQRNITFEGGHFDAGSNHSICGSVRYDGYDIAVVCGNFEIRNDVPLGGWCSIRNTVDDNSEEIVQFSSSFNFSCVEFVSEFEMSFVFGYISVDDNFVVLRDFVVGNSFVSQTDLVGNVTFVAKVYGGSDICHNTFEFIQEIEPFVVENTEDLTNLTDLTDSLISSIDNTTDYNEALETLSIVASIVEVVESRNESAVSITITVLTTIQEINNAGGDQNVALDEESLATTLVLIDRVTNDQESIEGEESTNILAMEVFSEILTENSESLTTETVVIGASIISDILVSSNAYEMEECGLNEQVIETTQIICQSLCDNLEVGEEQIIENEGLVIVGIVSEGDDIERVIEYENGMNISIPNPCNGSSEQQSPIGVSIAVFSRNIHSDHDLGENITVESSVVSVNYQTNCTTDSLETPVEIVFVTSPSDNLTTPENYSCSFWCDGNATWMNDGLWFGGYSVGTDEDGELMYTITCLANHTTDFSLVLDRFVPDLNFLSPEDVKNIEKLNQNNFLTFIVVSVMAIFYLVMMILLEFVDSIEIAMRKVPNMLEAGLKIRHISADDPKYIQRAIRVALGEHILLSVIFPREREVHFSRQQRITVFYLSVISSMMQSALTFGTENRGVFQMISSIIVSNIITAPVVLIISFFFLKTDPKWRLIFWKKTTVVPVTSPQDNESTELMETSAAKKKLGYQDELWSSTSQADEDDEEEDGPLKKVNFVLRLLNLQIDKVVKFLEKSFERTTVPGLIIFGLSSLVYVGICVGVSFILFNELTWSNGVSGIYFFVVICVLLYVLVVEVIFMYSKVKSYLRNRDSTWYSKNRFVTAFQLVLSILIMVISVGIFCSLIAVIFAVPNIPIENGVDLLISTCVFFGGCFIGGFLWLIFLVKKPNRKKQHEKQLEIENQSSTELTTSNEQPIFFFPFFCKYIWYILSWLFIAGASFVLVLYGIKFDGDYQNPNSVSQKWLISSGTSSAEELFLQEPIAIFFKAVILYATIRLFEMMFFRKKKTEKDEEEEENDDDIVEEDIIDYDYDKSKLSPLETKSKVELLDEKVDEEQE